MDFANDAKHAIERLSPRSLKHLSSQLQALVEGRLWLKVIIGMVAGISLTALYAKNGWFGQFLEPLGIQVAFKPLGVLVAWTGVWFGNAMWLRSHGWQHGTSTIGMAVALVLGLGWMTNNPRATGVVPEEPYEVPIGKLGVAREGNDLSIATVGLSVHRALDAAEALEENGISAEVLDLRSLVPLDREGIVRDDFHGADLISRVGSYFEPATPDGWASASR